MFRIGFVVLNLLLVLIICFTACSSPTKSLQERNHQNHFVNGVRKLYRRNAIKTKNMKWPDKTVIYEIDSSINGYEAYIENAIKEIEEKSCVRFHKRNGERNFVRIFSGKTCSADIGYESRPEQTVSLKVPNCMCHAVVLHELMHTLGFIHMHSRSDRHKYIKIHWENVNATDRGRFLQMRPHQDEILTPFDFDSVMLYGNTTYSKDKVSPTITALDGTKVIDVCEKPGLSYYDVQAINRLYDC